MNTVVVRAFLMPGGVAGAAALVPFPAASVGGGSDAGPNVVPE